MNESPRRTTDEAAASGLAVRLLEANEQLVLSALRAFEDAEQSARALSHVSASAEVEARAQSVAQQKVVQLNAVLERRVSERTAELEKMRDEALAAVRAKDRFLANMSHEIRTPMYGMLGALELLSGTALTPQQAEYIAVASASGEALLGVINEVLDFAKIHAEQLRLAPEPIDVNAIARSVLTLFAAAAKRKAIELRLDADPALSVWRLGDALHIRQVLLNLVGNALKFTQHGSVVVATSAEGDTGDGVAFTVADTGPGIDASQHDRIFEPFVQADAAVGQAVRGGSGLGLSISRQLARAMGGELRVDSALGQGATFRFELALARAPGAASPHAPQDAVPAAAFQLSGPVLLVEDNSVSSMIGAAMLATMGIDVVLAENGEQALARFAEGKIVAVLMDCQMPVMDGYEATIRLRETERLGQLQRTPVIALTANAFVGDVERCLAAGMDAHLAKPFTLEQLRAVLTRWVG